MALIGTGGQRWLKGIHLLCASLWAGGGTALALQQFFVSPADGRELYGILWGMHFVDLYVIVPGAMGCLITGILYSALTGWGWFRHRWIAVKWAICLYGVAFGTYPLGPWLAEMVEIAGRAGMAALTDPTYCHNREMSMIFGTLQAASILFAVFISALKPWRRKPERQ
ncbi:MAG: hypothetical protein JXA20_16410 [Spirochaetes bacterium]|nr:hypothetical protein [Spirochaetota bacterium]